MLEFSIDPETHEAFALKPMPGPPEPLPVLTRVFSVIEGSEDGVDVWKELDPVHGIELASGVIEKTKSEGTTDDH